MNKEDLVHIVGEKTGLSRAKSKEAVEAVFGAVISALVSGERFQYSGFGSFAVKNSSSRIGVNPQTKEKIRIASKKRITYTPGKDLTAKVNKHKKS